MARYDDSRNLKEEWHTFLQKDVDAQVIIHRLMERTGLSEDEVLFYMMDMWAEQNLTREQRRSFDEWVCELVSIN
jgi:hypothetical protein